MPSIADLLAPQEPIPCPHCIKRGLHGNMLLSDLDRQRGYCMYCAMIPPHKADSGFRLNTEPYRRVTYRSEAEAYGERIEDDD